MARILTVNVLPEIGHRSADAVTRADVGKVVEKVARRGAKRAADHTLGVIRAVYGWANDRGLLDGIDPTRSLKKRNGTRPRTRVLDDGEIRWLWHRLDRPSPLSPEIRDALRLQLLLGARIGEIVGARTSEFDIVRKAWTIPDSRTKNRHEHRLPLSEFAIEIIKARAGAALGRRSWIPGSAHSGERL